MNEVFEVLTVRELNFQDQTGRPVQGLQLWLIHDVDDPSWRNQEVLKTWIPSGSRMEAVVHSLKRGDMIQITWNRRGKPEYIEPIR